jgi:hypothetical protein
VEPQTRCALRTGSHAMPILPLTARTFATLRAPSDKPRIEYFDAEAPGLMLRITSDGVKTWTMATPSEPFTTCTRRRPRRSAAGLSSGASSRTRSCRRGGIGASMTSRVGTFARWLTERPRQRRGEPDVGTYLTAVQLCGRARRIEANSALRCEAAKASSRTWVVSSGRGVLLDLPGSSDNGRR